MNRADAAAIVASRYPTQLADAGMTGADTPGNLKEPLDDALLALGHGYDDLAGGDDRDPMGFVTLARYYTLRAVLARVSDRFDLSSAGDSLRLSQTVEQVRALLAIEAQGVMAMFGNTAPAPASSANPFVTVDLNYLEPVE